MNDKEIGRIGEEFACEYLVKHGFKIVDRNYRTRIGEIDIITLKDGIMAFVEVKARTSWEFGPPEEAITPYKQRQVRSMAGVYLAKENPRAKGYRFDAVCIDLDPATMQVKDLRHYENAFDGRRRDY
jgi:putative endonuclease